MLAYRCSEYLDLLHVPSNLSTVLANKISNGDVGLNGKFKLTEVEGRTRLVSSTKLPAFEDIWVVPHLHCTVRSRLYKELQDNPKLKLSLIDAFRLAASSDVDEVFEEYWNWCFTNTVGLEEEGEIPEELHWHVESSEILTIPHADAPNVIVRALPPAIYASVKLDIFKKGASIVCVTSALTLDQMLKRDLLPRKRTRSRIARLLALIGDSPDRWAHEEEFAGLKQLNDCTPMIAGKFEVTKPVFERTDTRPLAAMTEFDSSVFSDYPSVHRYLKHPAFELVLDFDSSNILFAFCPVASFNNLGRRLVNQFPKESCLLNPRQLLHAVRSEHHGQNDPKADSVVIGNTIRPFDLLPSWFPLSFDLKTEIRLFLEIKEQIDDPWWMLINAEAGAMDWCITAKTKTIIKFMEANEGNWVVQKMIPQPFLHNGRKAMMHLFLLICAFDPIEAYLYKYAQGTVATSPYSLNAKDLADDAVHLPFEDPTQTVLLHDAFVEMIEAQGIQWSVLLEEMCSTIKDLIRSVQRQIGPSQRSRAIYRLDFRLPAVQQDEPFKPQLARVTFAPNLEIPSEFNPKFVDEVFESLFLDERQSKNFVPINDGLLESGETDITDVID